MTGEIYLNQNNKRLKYFCISDYHAISGYTNSSTLFVNNKILLYFSIIL